MSTRAATATSNEASRQAAAHLIRDVKDQLVGEIPKLVVLFASTKQPLSEILPLIQAGFPGAQVVGASTAGEFTEAGDTTGSANLFALAGDYQVAAGIGTNLTGGVEAAVRQATANLPTECAGYAHRSALLLIDGLCGAGEEVTLTCAMILGPDVKVAGGAAGDDWAAQKTFVGLGDQVATNALVIAQIFSKSPLGIGVRHGHKPFSREVEVTKSDANIVREIDGRPAWDVFVELTRDEAMKNAGLDPLEIKTPGEAMQFFARYQPGISIGQEFRNRTPLAKLPDGALAFACGIPVGTKMKLLRSTPAEQIESARAAAKEARHDLGDAKPAGALVFDCGCRKVFLGDQFGVAARAISEELGGAPIVGFESYGEIALNLGDFSGFHNTTTVLIVFPQ